VYVYGFEKKDRANIKAFELEAFRELASLILGFGCQTGLELCRWNTLRFVHLGRSFSMAK